jgi:diguanylate cyclase (GGDEF)-like protein
MIQPWIQPQPRKDQSAVAIPLRSDDDSVRPPLRPSASVLIVEDEPLVSMDIRESLGAIGYEVVGVARSADDALDCAARRAVDLVLMDIRIQGSTDGIDAAIALQARYPVPVVYLTSNTDDETLRRALASDPDGYLVKPFSPRGLRTAIELALRKHKIAQEHKRTTAELERQRRASEQRTDEIGLLNELSELLHSCEDLSRAYATLARFGPLLLPTLSGSIGLLDDSRTFVETVAEWGGNGAALVFSPDECCALKNGRQHQWQVGFDEEHCEHHEPLPVAATLCHPLIADDEVIGVFSLRYSNRVALIAPVATRVAEWRFVSALSQQIATALRNLLVRDRLQSESIIDPITKLYNRRHMERSLSKEISLAVRKREPVSVIMLDIDHFKSFNDRYGHAAGDLVLRALSGVILSTIRAYDTACRYGGEEIVLVLPRTNSADAAMLAERLRSGIGTLELECDGTALPAVTVSMGIATCPTSGIDPPSLLHASDSALYRAKELGRDRMVIA